MPAGDMLEKSFDPDPTYWAAMKIEKVMSFGKLLIVKSLNPR